MPGRARLAVAEIAWHIVQRGINRSACVFWDEDYHYFLDTLAQQARKHDCVIHAGVLMTNNDLDQHLCCPAGAASSNRMATSRDRAWRKT